MEGLELRQHPPQPFVAARSGSAAFNSEAVAFADGVEIREVRYAPCAAAVRTRVEGVEIAGLGHGRVGNCPNQPGRREIRAHQHDAVG